jgi:2-polyprenyl-3-methyl-5-hydroxy-6-metoxy-1,4-benzoquinol methylase
MEDKIKKYFSEKAFSFDAIYSQNTSPLRLYLNRLLRWDMIERMKMAYNRLSKENINTILDIGCGSGRLALELAKIGKKVLGIDFSSKMIEMANDFKEKTKRENVEFLCLDILDYKPDKEFDASLALGFFDYTKDPLMYLKKISSLTKYLLIATFPRKGTLRAFIRKMRLSILGCPVYFYTAKEINSLLDKAGFKIEELIIIGQLYFVEAHKYDECLKF